MKFLNLLLIAALAGVTTGCMVTPIRDWHSPLPSGSAATVILGRNNDDARLYSAIKNIDGKEVATDTWMYRVPKGKYDVGLWLTATEGSDFGAFLSIYGGVGGSFKMHTFLYQFDQAQFDEGRTYRLRLDSWSELPKKVCFESRPTVQDEARHLKNHVPWQNTQKESCGTYVKKIR